MGLFQAHSVGFFSITRSWASLFVRPWCPLSKAQHSILCSRTLVIALCDVRVLCLLQVLCTCFIETGGCEVLLCPRDWSGLTLHPRAAIMGLITQINHIGDLCWLKRGCDNKQGMLNLWKLAMPGMCTLHLLFNPLIACWHFLPSQLLYPCGQAFLMGPVWQWLYAERNQPGSCRLFYNRSSVSLRNGIVW